MALRVEDPILQRKPFRVIKCEEKILEGLCYKVTRLLVRDIVARSRIEAAPHVHHSMKAPTAGLKPLQCCEYAPGSRAPLHIPRRPPRDEYALGRLRP